MHLKKKFRAKGKTSNFINEKVLGRFNFTLFDWIPNDVKEANFSLWGFESWISRKIKKNCFRLTWTEKKCKFVKLEKVSHKEIYQDELGALMFVKILTNQSFFGIVN
jgi:hypothetical protein